MTALVRSGSRAQHRFDNKKRRRTESHDRQRQLTPDYILEPIRELLSGIGLDPCTERDNPTGATRFYAPPQDGCALPWGAQTVFCNPPYGEIRKRWVEKCIAESAGRSRKIVLLIPAHTETGTFQLAAGACTSMLLIRARVMFAAVRKNGRHEAASHGSALFGFNVSLKPLRKLGLVFERVA